MVSSEMLILVVYGNQYINLQLINLERERDFKILSPKCDVRITHLSSRLKDLCGRGAGCLQGNSISLLSQGRCSHEITVLVAARTSSSSQTKSQHRAEEVCLQSHALLRSFSHCLPLR